MNRVGKIDKANKRLDVANYMINTTKDEIDIVKAKLKEEN